MQKNNYLLSKLAQIHLQKIKIYTVTNFSEAQWQNFKDVLLTGFQMLANNPGIGIDCNNLYPNGCYFPIGKHIAYFTREKGFTLVVAVLGRSQLPQKHLIK